MQQNKFFLVLLIDKIPNEEIRSQQ